MIACLFSNPACHLLCCLQWGAEVPTVNRGFLSCSAPSHSHAGWIWTFSTHQTLSSLAAAEHCTAVWMLTTQSEQTSRVKGNVSHKTLFTLDTSNVLIPGGPRPLTLLITVYNLRVNATLSGSIIHQNYSQNLRKCYTESFILKDTNQDQSGDKVQRMRFGRSRQVQSFHVLRTPSSHTSVCITTQDPQPNLDVQNFQWGFIT